MSAIAFVSAKVRHAGIENEAGAFRLERQSLLK